MSNRPTGIIRKIILGQNPLNGLAFTVAKNPGAGLTPMSNVSQIIEDSDHYYTFGVIRYYIYFMNEKGIEILWKSFTNVSVTIEYDTEAENNLV